MKKDKQIRKRVNQVAMLTLMVIGGSLLEGDLRLDLEIISGMVLFIVGMLYWIYQDKIWENEK